MEMGRKQHCPRLVKNKRLMEIWMRGFKEGDFLADSKGEQNILLKGMLKVLEDS